MPQEVPDQTPRSIRGPDGATADSPQKPPGRAGEPGLAGVGCKGRGRRDALDSQRDPHTYTAGPPPHLVDPDLLGEVEAGAELNVVCGTVGQLLDVWAVVPIADVAVLVEIGCVRSDVGVRECLHDLVQESTGGGSGSWSGGGFFWGGGGWVGGGGAEEQRVTLTQPTQLTQICRRRRR